MAIEDFEFGEHGAAAEKLRKILEPPQLTSREDLIVARQYLGACYHLLDDKAKAKTQFSMLLALDPKHKLDPEVFSPALVELFEEVRRETGLPLPKVTPEKPPPAPSEGGAKAGAPPVIERDPPPAALALIPFGVGQFTNRHPVRGALFAVTEVGLFATSIATLVMFEGLKLPAGQGGCAANQACFAPEDRDSADTLQSVYLATFWTGIAVTALGIVEALISYPGDHHLVNAAPAARGAGAIAASPGGLSIVF